MFLCCLFVQAESQISHNYRHMENCLQRSNKPLFWMVGNWSRLLNHKLTHQMFCSYSAFGEVYFQEVGKVFQIYSHI